MLTATQFMEKINKIEDYYIDMRYILREVMEDYVTDPNEFREMRDAAEAAVNKARAAYDEAVAEFESRFGE